MTGSWGTYRDGQRWRRAPRRAWLVLRTDGGRGRPVRRPGARAADRVAHALRPPPGDARPRHPRARARRAARSCARLRADDPTRAIGDALLDQRTIAGIGNLWKCEGCFAAQIDPVAPDGRASATTRRWRSSAPRARGCSSPRWTGCRTLHRVVYAQAGRPCPRCGAPIRSRGQGDDNRADVLVRGMPVVSARAARHAPRRAQGRRPHRAGQHVRLLRRRAGARRRHDRVRRAPRARDGSGELLLAHDYEDAAGRRAHTLDEGLEHFAGAAYDGIELDVDLKLTGYEERVVAALREHGLADRALVSTMENASLKLLRERHPELRLGWSLPRMRRDPLANPRHDAARGGRPDLRAPRRCRASPPTASAAARSTRSWPTGGSSRPRLAAAVGGAGGELYAWTVDDAARIAGLERCGVTGVITNDPRLFGPC